MKSQNEMVLAHLEHYGEINPRRALSRYGIMRLGARIYDLRAVLGKDCIRTQKVTKKNRFGRNTTFANYIYDH